MGPVSAYLPGVEVNHDQQGGSSRMRLSHCTSGRLTPTMVSNVDHLNAQFLLVGDCVRAIPLIITENKCQRQQKSMDSGPPSLEHRAPAVPRPGVSPVRARCLPGKGYGLHAPPSVSSVAKQFALSQSCWWASLLGLLAKIKV